MKRLLLLLSVLLAGVSGAWADVTVTISDQTDLDGITPSASESEATATHKYGTYSGSDVANTPYYTTFTTNATSGLAGVTLSTTAKILKPTYVGGTNVAHYGHLLAINYDYTDNTTVYTFTIQAPSGYYIKGYAFTALSTSDSAPFKIIPAGGSTYTAKGYLYKQNVTATTCASAATFTVQRTSNNNNNYLCIPTFTVTLAAIPTYDGSYTELNINNTTGSLNSGDNNWSNTWTSDKTTPNNFTLTANFNNMKQSASEINIHSASTPTYTLTAPDGYFIAGYTIGLYGGGPGSLITPSGYGATPVSASSSNPTFVCVTGLSTKKTTFTRSGSSTDGHATTFKVYLKAAVPITYVVKNSGGTTIYTSDPVDTWPGSAITSLPAKYQRDFCSYSEVSTTADIEKSVEFTATWDFGDFPMEISDTYEDAHWYNMSVRSTWYVTSDQVDEDDALLTVNANALGLVTNAYQWAFVGTNPYNIKLYNKDKGEDLVYSWTGTSDKSVPTFVDAATANPWAITASTATGYTNAFQLNIPDYNYQVNQHGGAGGSLKIWANTTTSDSGSAFKVFDVPDDFAEYVTSEIAPYMENSATYFNWTNAARTAIGYDASYKTSCTYAKYAEMKSALATALSDLNSNVNFPEPGYYRIKNRLTTDSYGYMGLNGGTNLLGNISNTNDASTIIHLTKSGSKYYFQTQGKYTSNVRKDEAVSLVDATPSEAFAMQAQAIGYAAFRTWDDGPYSYYHASSDKGYKIVGWEHTAHASQWSIEEASSFSITLNSDGAGTPTYYATGCWPFDVTITGTNAYTLAKSGDWLVPTEVTDNKVPAGTPVLLKGSAATATATINTGDAFNSGSPLSCALTGTYTGKTINGATDFVLGIYEGVVGFYHWDSDNLGANRAYYDTPAAPGVKGFKVQWDVVDAVKSVDNAPQAESAIFNIAGQRLNKMQKGVNIVNGKAIIVK